jgi:hypothetical protein
MESAETLKITFCGAFGQAKPFCKQYDSGVYRLDFLKRFAVLASFAKIRLQGLLAMPISTGRCVGKAAV